MESKSWKDSVVKNKFDLTEGNANLSLEFEVESCKPKNFKEISEMYSWNNISAVHSRLDWCWQYWVARGYLTMLVGMSGIGKSSILLRLCGCFTNGWDYPDGSPYLGKKGMALWCEGEASQGLNLSRAKNMGLDTGRLLSLFRDPFIDFDMENNSHNKQFVQMASLPEVQIICIDSYSGVHAGDENHADMNQNTNFLAKVARDLRKPIILTHHLRKKGQFEKNIVDLDRVRGSSAIIQTARTVIAIDHPNLNSSIKRLNVIKSNLSAPPKPIGFKITEKGIVFSQPPIEIVAKKELDRAKEFLLRTLANGPAYADEITKLAKDEGIAERTLVSAKSLLHIQSKRVGGSNGKWQWRLRDPSDPPLPPF